MWEICSARAPIGMKHIIRDLLILSAVPWLNRDFMLSQRFRMPGIFFLKTKKFGVGGSKMFLGF